jgi:predicted membrane-bound mannosyltransferase
MGGLVWTEALLPLLAVTGVCMAGRPDPRRPLRHHLVRFLAAYALVTFLIYSAIPYKTPWCMMTFVQTLALLGGVGAAAAAERARHGPRAWVLAVLLALACTQLAREAWAAAFRANDDRTCPYAYVQTTEDIPVLAGAVEGLTVTGQADGGPTVQVMATGHDYWPLPWYLRRLESVGYYDRVPEGPPAQILIISPNLRGDLVTKLFGPGAGSDLYIDLARTWPAGRIELRPHVPLKAYVRADLWESRGREEPPDVR